MRKNNPLTFKQEKSTAKTKETEQNLFNSCVEKKIVNLGIGFFS